MNNGNEKRREREMKLGKDEPIVGESHVGISKCFIDLAYPHKRFLHLHVVVVVLVEVVQVVSIRMNLLNDLPKPRFQPILIHMHTNTQHLIKTPIPSFSLFCEELNEIITQPNRNEKRKEKRVVVVVGGRVSAWCGSDVECLVGKGEEAVGQEVG